MVWITALIGLMGGLMGGMFGVGGGLIFVPLLMKFRGFDIHHAIGTSMMVIIFTAIFGALFHHKAGMVDVKAALLMGIFSILGVWIGTQLSVRMDIILLKRVFAVFLTAVAIKLFFFK